MIYRRELLDQIWPLLDTAQAIVVTGMRRCGKTFLLRDIYAKIEFDDLLNGNGDIAGRMLRQQEFIRLPA